MTFIRPIVRAFFAAVFAAAAAAPVFAETASVAPSASALVRQGHPVFYDLDGGPPPLDGLRDRAHIHIAPQSLRGRTGDWLVKIGFLRPKYAVDIRLSPEKADEAVKKITWEFPKEYYFDESARIEEPAVKVDAWRSFAVKARVEFENGDSQTYHKWVDIPPVAQ